MGARDAETVMSEQGDDPIRIQLSVPLPCGLGACRRPASEALTEPDPVHPGAWVLMPICSICDAAVQARARWIAVSV